MQRHPLLFAALVFLPACASTPPPVPAAPPSATYLAEMAEKQQNDLILTKLETTLVDIEPADLRSILKHVQAKTSVNMVTLWNGLNECNAGTRVPYSIKLHQVSAKAALLATFKCVEDQDDSHAHLTFSIHQGILWVGAARDIREATSTTKVYDLEPLFAERKQLIDLLNESELPTQAMASFARAHGLDEYIGRESNITKTEKKIAKLQEQALALDHAIKTLAKKTKTDITDPSDDNRCSWGAMPVMNFMDAERIMEDFSSTLKAHVGLPAEWNDGLSTFTYHKFSLTVHTSAENHAAIRKLLDEHIAIETQRQESLLADVYVMHFLAAAWQTLDQTKSPSAALKQARKALAIAPRHSTAKAMVMMLERMEKQKIK